MSSQCLDQAATGSLPSPKMTGLSPHRCPPESATSEDNWKKVEADFDTGNYTPFWNGNQPLEPANDSSAQLPTASSRDHKQRATTYGKKIPALPKRNSSLETSPCAGRNPRTGTKFTHVPRAVSSKPYPVMFWFVATTNCAQFAMTTKWHWALNEAVKSTGVLQAQENQEGPGMKPVWTVSLKILAPNGGMDTLVRSTSSLMNSEVQSTLRTSYAGLIGIRFAWNVKVNHCHCEHPEYGLHQTFAPPCGFQI